MWTVCVPNNFCGIGWSMKVDRIASNEGLEYRRLLTIGDMLNANAHQARGRVSRVVMNLAVE